MGFKEGDKVCLITHPDVDMVIEGYDADTDMWECVWLDNDLKQQRGLFKASVLHPTEGTSSDVDVELI